MSNNKNGWLQMQNVASVTFSTCWYNFKCKFNCETYYHWIDNFLSNVNHYNLVVYSNEESSLPLLKYLPNPRIRLIIKPHQEFYNYKYRDDWMRNHEINTPLKDRVDWKVNMLWSEKIHFVHETKNNKYFDTDFYGWCDIGYFRCTPRDLSKHQLNNWASTSKLNELKRDKIYYALVNNDESFIECLYNTVMNKNDVGLPILPIHPVQISVAGGFFLTYKDNVEWWRNTYDERLSLYFQHKYLVKDDQMIIIDCIFSNLSRFCLCKEENEQYDNWFLFQRFLMDS